MNQYQLLYHCFHFLLLQFLQKCHMEVLTNPNPTKHLMRSLSFMVTVAKFPLTACSLLLACHSSPCLSLTKNTAFSEQVFLSKEFILFFSKPRWKLVIFQKTFTQHIFTEIILWCTTLFSHFPLQFISQLVPLMLYRTLKVIISNLMLDFFCVSTICSILPNSEKEAYHRAPYTPIPKNCFVYWKYVMERKIKRPDHWTIYFR